MKQTTLARMKINIGNLQTKIPKGPKHNEYLPHQRYKQLILVEEHLQSKENELRKYANKATKTQ